MKNRIFKFFVAFVLLFAALNFSTDIVYTQEGKLLDQVVFSDYKFTDSLNNTITSTSSGHNLRVGFNWDATSYQNTLKEGDYFNVTFSENYSFKRLAQDQRNFPLRNEKGDILANVTLTENPAGGGVAKVVLTKAVEHKYNVKGNVYFIVGINYDKFNNTNGKRTFDVFAGGLKYTTEIEVKFFGPKDISKLLISKGAVGKIESGQVEWSIFINPKKSPSLANIVIRDEIIEKDLPPTSTILNRIEYVENSFVLHEYEMNQFGEHIKGSAPIISKDVSNSIRFAPDKRSFTYHFGNANGKQYKLVYRSTYFPGYIASNKATLTADNGISEESSSGYAKSLAGGGAQADILGKIKIIKTDFDDAGLKLSGAKFEVKNANGTGETIILTTDQHGEAMTGLLPDGEYIVREINAPTGYILEPNERKVKLLSTASTIIPVQNKKEKTHFEIFKLWKNYTATIPNSKFQLKADGANYGPVITLEGSTATQVPGSTDFKNTYRWDNLPKYRSDNTTPIQYTVVEVDVPPGFTDKIENATANSATIINTYAAKEVYACFELNKQLTGRPLHVGEFSFVLNDGVADIQTKQNTADGNIKFDAIQYTTPGEYRYTIKEVKGQLPGVKYSEAIVNAVVIVRDNGQGQLVKEVRYEGNKTFTNEYTPASTTATIELMKQLTGRTLNANEFHFNLKQGDIVLQTKHNDSDGKILFDAITYTKAGQYQYTVEEVAGNLGGMTYSTERINITVEVTDDQNGKLVANVVYPSDKTFNNIYQPANTTAVLEVNKALIGRLLKGGEFHFNLKQGNTILQTKQNDLDGKITFDAITYTKAGQYQYTVEEVAGDLGGITYSTETINITVEVIDNQNGKLVANVVYPSDKTFDNTYTTKAVEINLELAKQLTGRPLKDNEFSFVLNDGVTDIQTKQNTADGRIKFDAIQYTKPGTYNYTVKEVKGSVNGVVYSTETMKIQVTVTDNLLGQLVAKVKYPENKTFTNEYTPASTTATLEVNKVLTGRALKAGEFHFNLKQGDVVLQTKQNTVDGKITFDAITYTKVGQYQYTVEEVVGNLGGMTYSTETMHITVEVTDDQNGKLVANVIYPVDKTFNNTYQPAHTTTMIELQKELTGRLLKGNEFSFVLMLDGNVVQMQQNDENGQILFENIRFEKPGEYRFTVEELQNQINGIIYSREKIDVVVEVKDNLEGALVALVHYPEDRIFNNQYQPAGANASFKVFKELSGRQLFDNEFSFVLNDGTKDIQMKKNIQGEVQFDAIQYVTPGIYKYTVTEIDEKLPGIEYSKEKIEIIVEVVDDLKGNLIANVKYPTDITFNNVYIPTVDPKKKIETSDNTVVYITLFGLSLIGLFILRKNK